MEEEVGRLICLRLEAKSQEEILEADREIAKLGASPGFTTALCRLLVNSTLATPHLQYAGVVLRRQIVNCWTKYEEKEDVDEYEVCEYQDPELSEDHVRYLAEMEAIEEAQIQIPDEDKAELRNTLPSLLGIESRSIRNSIALALATIGQEDSDEWPTFHIELIDAIANCSDLNLIRGVFRCLHIFIEDVFDERLTEIIPKVLETVILYFSDEYQSQLQVPAEILAEIIRVLYSAVENLCQLAFGERRFEPKYFPLLKKRMISLLQVVDKVVNAAFPEIDSMEALNEHSQNTLQFEVRGTLAALMKLLVAHFPKSMSAHSEALLQITMHALLTAVPTYMNCAVWSHSVAGLHSIDQDHASPLFGLPYYLYELLDLVELYAATPKTLGKPIRPRLEEMFQMLLSIGQFSVEQAQTLSSDLTEYAQVEDEDIMISNQAKQGGADSDGEGAASASLSTSAVRSAATTLMGVFLDRWPVSAPVAAIKAAGYAIEMSESLRQGDGEGAADWWKYRETATYLVGRVLEKFSIFRKQDILTLEEIPSVILDAALSPATACGQAASEDTGIVLLQCRGAWIARPTAQAFIDAAKGAEAKGNLQVKEECMRVVRSIAHALFAGMDTDSPSVLRFSCLHSLRFIIVQMPEAVPDIIAPLLQRCVHLATMTPGVSVEVSGWALEVARWIQVPIREEMRTSGRWMLTKHGLGASYVEAAEKGPLEAALEQECFEITKSLYNFWRQHSDVFMCSDSIRIFLQGLMQVPGCLVTMLELLFNSMVEVLESKTSTVAERRFAQTLIMRMIRTSLPNPQISSQPEILGQFPVELVTTRVVQALYEEAVQSVRDGQGFTAAFSAASFIATTLAVFNNLRDADLIAKACELADVCLTNILYEGEATRVARLLSQLFIRHSELSEEQFNVLVTGLVKAACGLQQHRLLFPLICAFARLIAKFPEETFNLLAQAGEISVEVEVGKVQKKKKFAVQVLKKRENHVIEPFSFLMNKLAEVVSDLHTPNDTKLLSFACAKLLGHLPAAQALLSIPVRGYLVVKARKKAGVKTRNQRRLTSETEEYTDMSAAARFLSFISRVSREEFAKANLVEPEKDEGENEDGESDAGEESEDEAEDAELLRQMGVDVIEHEEEEGEFDEAEDEISRAHEKEMQRALLKGELSSLKPASSKQTFADLEEFSTLIDENDLIRHGDDLDDDDDFDVEEDGDDEGATDINNPEIPYDTEMSVPIAQELSKLWTHISPDVVNAAIVALDEQDRENVSATISVLEHIHQ